MDTEAMKVPERLVSISSLYGRKYGDSQYGINTKIYEELVSVKKLISDTNQVPIWEKYTLSIDEAAEYFRIGQKRMRQIVAEHPDADWILQNGNRVQIKRKMFEEYIDYATVV